MDEHAREMSLPQTCRRLGLRWPAVYNLVLSGALAGRQVSGRWWVDLGSIEHFERERSRERAVPAA